MNAPQTSREAHGLSRYRKPVLSHGLSQITISVLTIGFADQWEHSCLNLSNLYMAALMVAPMGLIMLRVMRGMFPGSRLHAVLPVGFVALWMSRAQALVGDDQFLQAMIPDHPRAILACQEATIPDPEIEQLCTQIIATQEEEIEIMTGMLNDRRALAGYPLPVLRPV